MWVIKSEKGYLCDEDDYEGYTLDIDKAIVYTDEYEALTVIEEGKNDDNFPEEKLVGVEYIGLREIKNDN